MRDLPFSVSKNGFAGIAYDSLPARLSEMEEYKGKTETELQEIAYDETIAEMSETILTDTDAANRLSQEIYKQDRTLWQKIKDFFTGLVEKLRSAYKDSDPDSDIGRILKQAVRDNEQIAQAWAEAVSEAGENYQLQDGQKKNAREDVRYSERYLKAPENQEIAALTDKVASGNFNGKDRVYLSSISASNAKRIQGLTGIDVTGFRVAIEARQIEHILNGHGPNGETDHSMADLKNVAKMEYTLNNPDSIILSGTTRAYVSNVDGKNKPAKTVLYEKNIGEKSYYAVQAVADTKAKTLYIVSAFIGEQGYKKGTPQFTNAVSPGATSENAAVDVPTSNIPQSPAEVKGNVRYSSRSQQDSEYMELAKEPEENQFELETMVEDAAIENGFHYRRQTTRKYSPQRDGHIIMFVDGLDSNVSNYGDYVYFATDKGAIRVEDILPDLRNLAEDFYGEAVSDDIINPPDIVMSAGVWDDQEFVQYAWDQYFENVLDKTGVSPAIVTEDGLLMFERDDKRIKSGAAIEYDDNGNVIPLSQRFNSNDEDIRYSDRNSQSKRVERLEKMNAELKAEAEYLKQVVKIQKSGNEAHILDRNSVNAIGKGLMESVNAKGSEFGKLLNDFYRTLGTEEMSYETMQDKAGELAEWLLDHR